MLCGQFDSMPRLLEVGSSDHELHAANIQGSLDDIIQIIFMCLFAVVFSSKDWISQVDPDLPSLERGSASMQTCTHVSVPQRFSVGHRCAPNPPQLMTERRKWPFTAPSSKSIAFCRALGRDDFIS